MDYSIFIVGGVGVIAYIVYRISNRPNMEFFNYYEEVLSSDKYKVKNKYED